MRIVGRLLWAVVTALLWAGIASSLAAAGELVTFPTDSHGSKPTALLGYLARPAGEGPFPAVVVLHGCGGLSSTIVNWVDRLSIWGYVTLAVDSYGSRGIHLRCAPSVDHGFLNQFFDAGSAQDFLARQNFVDAKRIAVLGTSMGGTTALSMVERGGPLARLRQGSFRAAVALYPICGNFSGIMTAPTLVLVGDRDDWTPAEKCRAMAAGESEIGTTRIAGDRSMVQLVVYPNAYHSYDSALLQQGLLYHGHWLEFNKAATDQTLVEVRNFLHEKLAAK